MAETYTPEIEQDTSTEFLLSVITPTLPAKSTTGNLWAVIEWLH